MMKIWSLKVSMKRLPPSQITPVMTLPLQVRPYLVYDVMNALYICMLYFASDYTEIL